MRVRWYVFSVVIILTISLTISAPPDNKKYGSAKNSHRNEKHDVKGKRIKTNPKTLKPPEVPDKKDSSVKSEQSANSSEELDLSNNGTNLRRVGRDVSDTPWDLHPGADKHYGELARYDAITADTYVATSDEILKKEQRLIEGHWGRMKNRLYAEENLNWIYRLTDFHEGEYLIMLTRACYHLGTTYLNALDDLEDYYQIRYLYSNTLEYDMGYLVQEIVRRYTIVLELYHLVQYRFWNQSRMENIAPTEWMFHVYTNILEQVHDIIHLCNSLQELERKYTKPPHTPFEDIKVSKKRQTKSQAAKKEREQRKGVANANEDVHYYDNASEERAKQGEKNLEHYLNKKKKQEKRYYKEIQQHFIHDHNTWHSTMKTKRPVTFRDFPHHYGWSIEDW